MKEKSLGQIAYEAYFNFSEGKSLISGLPLPVFFDQAENIRNAWEAAGSSVAHFIVHGKEEKSE